jgi:uncharacterized protein YgbK (DUF1537 family)
MHGNDELLLSYYGDDFTGSTDVMESLIRAGVRTVLFIDPPQPEQLSRFPGLRGVGVAGISRSLSPDEMDQELPPVYCRFRELRTPIVHYKTCSTFDSTPEIGSIGHALDLGHQAFPSGYVPLLVGAPILGRYCVFGNLFARSGLESEVFRLDRHPTMRHHPITPMNESDIRVHLSRQTAKKAGLIDILQLGASEEEIERRREGLIRSGHEIVLFDVLDDRQLPVIGRAMWAHASREAPLFVCGSSGVEYALTAHWRAAGLLKDSPVFTGAGAVDQIVVVSGSCAPVTDKQIAWGTEKGFSDVALDASRCFLGSEAELEIHRATQSALRLMSEGRSVVIHTARGPQDPRIAAASRVLEASNADSGPSKFHSGKTIGVALGKVLGTILEKTRVRRVVVAGGDTCGFVARELGIEALEMIGPIAPGGPLCRVHAKNPSVDGREIIFKGGQVGKIDILGSVLRGAP